MGTLILFLALVTLLITVRVYALSLLRSVNAVRRVTASETVATSGGRSIVVGEHHADRDALARIDALLVAAHARGIRTLGVEACVESRAEYSGLAEEIDALRRLGEGELTQHDDRSSLDPDASGRRPRMNRYWYVRAALRLGWKIEPVDPHHWNWTRETAEGYLDSREPAMADAIRAHGPMIAVCGYGHLRGLSALLGGDAAYVVASAVRVDAAKGDAMWETPVAFAATLPLLDS